MQEFEKRYFPLQSRVAANPEVNSLQAVVDRISADFKEKIAGILQEEPGTEE